MKRTLTSKISIRALLVAIAFILSWVESQIPYPFPLPGMKLGLSNFVVLFALYRLTAWDALCINLVRIVLVGFTFGNGYSLAYSVIGGVLSFIIMFLLKKYTPASMKMISVAGGIAHNLGQILLATFVLQSTAILWYLPFLWISGLVAGFVIGLLCQLIVKRIPINLFLIFIIVSCTFSSCGQARTASAHFFAMDTFMTIEVNGSQGEEVLRLAQNKVEEFDSKWSTGLHNSEISLLNQTGSHSVCADTLNLIKRAQDIGKETDYNLDITVFPLMELWGFATSSEDPGDENINRVPGDEEIASCLSRVSFDNVLIDEASGKITLLNGASIDLGAVAKGYTTDIIVDILKQKNISSANINLGGNVYALGYKKDGSPWKIAIENPNSDLTPLKNAPYLGILSIHDKAVVTSGDYHRYFVRDGVKYHHIMDPQTGRPADSGLISVTIVSPEATLADGLSTALFVMGRDKALDYWSSHSDSFDCILVDSVGNITVTRGLTDCFKSDLAYAVYGE